MNRKPLTLSYQKSPGVGFAGGLGPIEIFGAAMKPPSNWSSYALRDFRSDWHRALLDDRLRQRDAIDDLVTVHLQAAQDGAERPLGTHRLDLAHLRRERETVCVSRVHRPLACRQRWRSSNRALG